MVGQVEVVSPRAFPPTKRTRRALIACTRCRRNRSKCKHSNIRPPCTGCLEAGPAVAETCVFLNRQGNKINPLPESPRPTTAIACSPTSVPALIHVQTSLTDIVSPDEILEGCRTYVQCCFQVDFVPKVRFLAEVQHHPENVNQFLLASLLAMSARFCEKLVTRFGGSPGKATNVFLRLAERMAPAEMYRPTLGSAQGFMLLGAAEWAKGDCNCALIHLGVAATMSGMLRLHREDTYTLPADAPPSDVVRAEEARRTLWMMGLLRNLFAGNYSPVPFALNELTALLPAEEQDAALGVVPAVRAALPYSQAAVDNPPLGAPNFRARSLFGTVIQAYQLWGRVARGACLDMDHPKRAREGLPPLQGAPLWSPDSRYAEQVAVLAAWEQGLSQAHAWSEWNIRVYRAQDLDIAFASIFVAVRLCNIVLRCSYLTEIRASLNAGIDTEESAFFRQMSSDLFANVLALHDGITLLLGSRPSSQGFPPLLPFALYSCGSLATQLSRCPQLCPQLVPRMPSILEQAKADLLAICQTWPIAEHWHSTLATASAGLQRSPLTAEPPVTPQGEAPALIQTPPYEFMLRSPDILRTPTPWQERTAGAVSVHSVRSPPITQPVSTQQTASGMATSPSHTLCLPFESARYPGTIMLGHEPTFAPEDSALASWVF